MRDSTDKTINEVNNDNKKNNNMRNNPFMKALVRAMVYLEGMGLHRGSGQDFCPGTKFSGFTSREERARTVDTTSANPTQCHP